MVDAIFTVSLGSLIVIFYVSSIYFNCVANSSPLSCCVDNKVITDSGNCMLFVVIRLVDIYS